MMEIKKYIVLLFISFLLGACSNYNQIIKGDDYQEKFRLANEMYEDKNYDRCIILYEQVYQHSPKTDEVKLPIIDWLKVIIKWKISTWLVIILAPIFKDFHTV